MPRIARTSVPAWIVCSLLLLASLHVPFSPARGQIETELYCEDFNNGPQGWVALDVDATRRPTAVFWHLDGGDWFCATTDICFADPGPGYGNNWEQRLDKSYLLPSPGPVNLDLHHQYDVESGFDFCIVEILPEGASEFVELQSFTGTSAGLVNSVVDLGAYAGTTVTIRFHVSSDNAFSDEDGLWPSDGAWRIDRLTVSGYSEEDFGTELGWTPSAMPLAPVLGALRLDPAPPCEVPDYLVDQGITSLNCEHPSPCAVSGQGGAAWVAFDPATQAFPEVPVDYERLFIPGIESPPIPIPPPVGTSEYQLVVDVFSDQTFQDTRVVWQQNFAYPEAGDPCPPEWEREYQWNSLRAEGWFSFTRIFSPPPGADNVLVRLNMGDWMNIAGASPGAERGRGPFFDNVRVLHVTAPPGPPYLECAPSITVPTTDCTFPAPEITIDHLAILRVLDDTTPRDQLIVNQTPTAGTLMSSGEVLTLSITDEDGLESPSCDVVVWNQATSVVTILDVSPGMLWPANHKMVPVTVTFGVEHECSTETGGGVIVLASSSEPDDGKADGKTTGDVNGFDGYTMPVEIPAEDVVENPDGSFSVVLELRAERSGKGEGRIYTIMVAGEDGGAPASAIVEVPHSLGPPTDTMPDVFRLSAASTISQDPAHPWADNVERVYGREGRFLRATQGKLILDLAVEYLRSTSAPEPVLGSTRPEQVGTPVLESVYPNPLQSSALVRFTLARPDHVVLSVIDVRGRLVRRLAQGPFTAGSHQVAWDGSNDRGEPAARGVYFIKLQTSQSEESRKVIVVH